MGVTIGRFRGGKFAEAWTLFDRVRLLEPLGFVWALDGESDALPPPRNH